MRKTDRIRTATSKGLSGSVKTQTSRSIICSQARASGCRYSSNTKESTQIPRDRAEQIRLSVTDQRSINSHAVGSTLEGTDKRGGPDGRAPWRIGIRCRRLIQGRGWGKKARHTKARE